MQAGWVLLEVLPAPSAGNSLSVALPLALSVPGKALSCCWEVSLSLTEQGCWEGLAPVTVWLGFAFSLGLNPWSRGLGAATGLGCVPRCDWVLIPGTASACNASLSLGTHGSLGGSACTQLVVLPSAGTFQLLTTHTGEKAKGELGLELPWQGGKEQLAQAKPGLCSLGIAWG